MRRTIRFTGAIAGAAALLMAGAQTSLAAGTDAEVSTQGAWGYFGAYGEHLNVRDTNGTDNASARAQLLIGGYVVGTVWASGGGDTGTLNLSVAEDQGYTLKVCRVVKSTGYVYNCGFSSGTT